jgi:hypothetical protein
MNTERSPANARWRICMALPQFEGRLLAPQASGLSMSDGQDADGANPWRNILPFRGAEVPGKSRRRIIAPTIVGTSADNCFARNC